MSQEIIDRVANRVMDQIERDIVHTPMDSINRVLDHILFRIRLERQQADALINEYCGGRHR